MTDELIGSPGCFGSIISYNPSDPVCDVCDFSSECGTKAYESMKKIRKSMDITKLSDKFDMNRIKLGLNIEVIADTDTSSLEPVKKLNARSILTADQIAIIENDDLPIKPRKLLSSIFSKGMDGEFILAALNNNINPFNNMRPKILDIACRLFLEGDFFKKDLFKAFEDSGMSRGTAHAQVSIVLAAFDILNIIEANTTQKLIKLRKKI